MPDDLGVMKTKKIIVMGETGFLGKYLCHWFAKLGWKFVAILRRGGGPEVACDGFHATTVAPDRKAITIRTGRMESRFTASTLSPRRLREASFHCASAFA